MSVDEEEETEIFDSARRPKPATQRGHDTSSRPTSRRSQPPPVREVAARDRSEPMRMISMKTPAEIPDKRLEISPNPHVGPPRVRRMSEVHKTPPRGVMGNFAPPRDVKEVRIRRLRDLVFWSLAVVVIGSLAMLAVVLLARR